MTVDSTPFDPPPAADDRSRWIALIVLCVGMLMIVLDVTVVNVALPSIQQDVGLSQSSLAWVVNAYLIAFGGLVVGSAGRSRRNTTSRLDGVGCVARRSQRVRARTARRAGLAPPPRPR
jgi:hypothetical protein